jgi:putative CRISPR-associated protein (TIGR02619 family)
MTPANKPSQYLHIVTIGTSLLANAGWRRGQRLPNKRVLGDLLKADPRKNSAELNALVPFIGRNECTRVHLISTDTPECQLCREAIGLFLRDQDIATNRDHATGLLSSWSNSIDQDSFYEAVRRFRDAVFRVADKARGDGVIVYLNVTGGLKAEIAVATLIAAELGLAAYYIHESMVEPVFLPTAPLDPIILKTLTKIQATVHHNPPLSTQEQDRLLREGLITVSHTAEGKVRHTRLTKYAKYLLKKPIHR